MSSLSVHSAAQKSASIISEQSSLLNPATDQLSLLQALIEENEVLAKAQDAVCTKRHTQVH